GLGGHGDGGADRRARGVGSDPSRQRGPLGALRARQRLFVPATLRGLAAEFELALRLNPNFSLAQGFYGLVLAYCSRWEEADEAARRALRLAPRDPFSAIYTGIAAYAQFVGRNYEEAMRL